MGNATPVLAASTDQTTASGTAPCLVCGGTDPRIFFELENVPVLCNAPCTTRDVALGFPTGAMRLAFCQKCGLVFNAAFSAEAMVYDQQYENSLHYSPTFDRYIRELAAELVRRFDLQGRDIIEIGCGKGDFLALLCQLGENRGTGFDPSYEPDRLAASVTERIRIVSDLYSEAYSHLCCDLLCCRHTLEHVSEPAAFLRSIRRALGNANTRTAVFFEVPNALYTLRHRGIWDIIYEHVSYFWAEPLKHLFSSSGFAVETVRETYGHQFVCVEATPARPGRTAEPIDRDALAEVSREVDAFGETFRETVQKASVVLDRIEAKGQRAVVWGTGSKGVTFLNIFRERRSLTHAVDINPHKQGRYVPGTGHSIIAPAELAELRPDVVFVMNPLYQHEIEKNLAGLSLSPELIPV